MNGEEREQISSIREIVREFQRATGTLIEKSCPNRRERAAWEKPAPIREIIREYQRKMDMEKNDPSGMLDPKIRFRRKGGAGARRLKRRSKS